jgi:hypothetical protein
MSDALVEVSLVFFTQSLNLLRGSFTQAYYTVNVALISQHVAAWITVGGEIQR